MAKPYWNHSFDSGDTQPPVQRHGCQHSGCDQPATWQWQRTATEEEVRADAAVEGPYGQVHRNFNGPHRVAVFACSGHAFPGKDGQPNLDVLALVHDHDCPAPDDGCNC